MSSELQRQNYYVQILWWEILRVHFTKVKHYFWVCLWGYLWKRWTFSSADWVKKSTPISANGHHPVTEGLNGTERWRKREFVLLAWAGTPPLCSDIGIPGSWIFRLGLNYFLVFHLADSRSWGLLSLHSKPIPIINLSVSLCLSLYIYIHVCIHMISYLFVSLENPNTEPYVIF